MQSLYKASVAVSMLTLLVAPLSAAASHDMSCPDGQVQQGNHCVDSTDPDHNHDGHTDNGNNATGGQGTQGSVSGIVFNDLNTNDIFDGSDAGLGGIAVVLHDGTGYNAPIIATSTTDAGGNYFFGGLSSGTYFVEELEPSVWDQTTSDKTVDIGNGNAHNDQTLNFANVAIPPVNGGGNNGGSGDTGSTTPPTPTTISIDASSVVCTNAADLPAWGKGGNGPISATTAKDWVAAHSSCSLTPGWSFEYAYQYSPFGGDTNSGHVDGFTAFGPTDVTGSTTVTFTPASTTAVQVREQLQSGYIPFTFTADPTNNTTPSAQMYCNSDVLNYDNGDFIYNWLAGNTYYCVAFNSPVPAPTDPSTGSGQATDNTPAPQTSGGGGGGIVISGPLSPGFVNTNSTGGVVLGTSTDATGSDSDAGLSCSALLKSYLRQGKHNDSNEVSKLQAFLNLQLGLHIPVTGFFGSMTTLGVNQFQTKYQSDVLNPWQQFGGDGKPTGYVYKTTLHKINAINCSTLNQPAPQLP